MEAFDSVGLYVDEVAMVLFPGVFLGLEPVQDGEVQGAEATARSTVGDGGRRRL